MKNIKSKRIRNDLNIIALIGECSEGKSLTLRRVISKLLERGERIIYPKKFCLYNNMAMINYLSGSERIKSGAVSDITVVFKVNNKIILVTSYGDEWQGLEKKLKKDADIFVIAAHRKFVKSNKVGNLTKVTKKGALITIGRNFYNSTIKDDQALLKVQSELQEEQAKFIVEEIYRLIS